MMIGIDIVQVSRMRESYERFGERFLKRILSSEEISKAKDRKEMFTFIAGRFAAREAFVKATGKKDIVFSKLEIFNDERGRPYIKDHEQVELSISHEKEYAVAVVLCR